MKGVYITIDFESVNARAGWFAYGIFVAEYPSGKLHEVHDGYCVRDEKEFDDVTRAFWEKNQLAWKTIEARKKNHTEEEAEKILCQQIQEITARYPMAYVVSDSPSYDVRILDNILTKNGFPAISNRQKKHYYQTICTWSFQMAVLAMFRIKSNEVRQKLMNHQFYTANREVDNFFGPRHTPNGDCARILSNHFCILDLMYLYGFFN